MALPEEFHEISGYLDALLDKAGRPRESVKRSMMIFVRFGRDQAELDEKLQYVVMNAVKSELVIDPWAYPALYVRSIVQ